MTTKTQKCVVQKQHNQFVFLTQCSELQDSLLFGAIKYFDTKENSKTAFLLSGTTKGPSFKFCPFCGVSLMEEL